jgi:flagellar hook-length control protein FliK
MTSANVVKLPVQTLSKSDQSKKYEKKDNADALSFQSELKNLVQDLKNESLKSLDSSNGISSLKSVMSNYSISNSSKISSSLSDNVRDMTKNDQNSNASTLSTDKVNNDISDYQNETPKSNASNKNDTRSSEIIDRSDGNKNTSISDKTADEVKSTIEKRLGVSDQQLESALEKLGLKIEDLQDPANLLSVAAYLVGNGDTQNLLLTNGIKELMDEVKSIFAEAKTDNQIPDSLIDGSANTDDKDVSLIAADKNNVVQTGSSADTVTASTDSQNGVSAISDDQLTANSSDAASTDADPILQNAQQDQENSENNTSAEGTNDASGARVQIVDKRTAAAIDATEDNPVTDNSVDDSTTVDAGSEVITNENTGNAGENKNGDGFDNDSSRFAKSFDTAKSTGTASQPEATANANISNPTTTFQSIFQQTTSSVTTTSTTYKSVNTENVINQIVQNAKVTLTDTENTMEMVLNPHELGKIFMEVSSKDGALRAKIFTENENVKNALENQMQLLQKNFDEKGFKIDAVEISVGTHQFRENQERTDTGFDMSSQNNGGGNGNDSQEADTRSATRRIDLNNLDNLRGLMTEEELLTAQIMKEQGNTVDYTA